MTAEWFCALRGRTEGPLDAATLLRQRRRGRLSDATPVWREGMDEWRPLGEVRDLLETDAEGRPLTGPVGPPVAPQASLEYRVVALRPLTAEALETLLHRWAPEGWRLDQVVGDGLVVLSRE